MKLLANSKSLRWIIFIRIAPAATVLLLVVVAINSARVSKSLRQEVQGRVDASAVHAARQTDTKLAGIASACTAVAANDMVVNGIVDLEHRQSTLLSYFRSLRLPGPKQQQITMTDYKGRVLASTSPDAKKYGTAPWYSDVMAGNQFVGTADSKLTIAVPVLYANRAEGIIVANFDLDEFLMEQIVLSETEAIVFHSDSSVVSSTTPILVTPAKTFDPPTDWLFATTELSSLPNLNVSYLESETVALAAATAINVSQFIQLLVLLSGLMTAIWLAARLARQPLHRMLEQVVAIEKTGDLSLRVDRDGPTEFVRLAEGFNGMLGKLQETTVSQQQYRTSEERLAVAIQGTNDGLWDWNLETNVVWFAPRYKEMLGYEELEFPNLLTSFETHLHPDDAESTEHAIKMHLEESIEYDVEHRLRKKSGEYCWFRARGAVARDRSGKAVRMSGSMQDISERKKYQQTVERSNRDLEQFAFIASHDLQEPLRKVASFCGLIREDNWEQLDDDGKKYVDYAIDGATRMRSLVLDLLAFSKIGSDTNRDTLIDTEAAFESAILNLGAAIEESQAGVTHDPLPSLIAHDREISQLFQNLIGNAIKYRSDRNPAIHVGVTSKRDHWQFSISDNGIGIAPEYQEQVFGIFKRLHTREKFSGTGIGLAICKRIVEQMDGEIWFETKPEPGCKICFTVPKQNTVFPNIQTEGSRNEHVAIAQPG